MYDAPHYMIGMHWIWWLVWIAVIAAAWWTLARRTAAQAEPTPIERLQRRYADGEITTEVYEEQKATLLRDR
jgi:putative membrane protein